MGIRLTSKTTRKQFAEIVKNAKGILELTPTDSLVFSMKAHKLGYDFEINEVVTGLVTGKFERNVSLHGALTEQESIDYNYGRFVNEFLPMVAGVEEAEKF